MELAGEFHTLPWRAPSLVVGHKGMRVLVCYDDVRNNDNGYSTVWLLGLN